MGEPHVTGDETPARIGAADNGLISILDAPPTPPTPARHAEPRRPNADTSARLRRETSNCSPISRSAASTSPSALPRPESCTESTPDVPPSPASPNA